MPIDRAAGSPRRTVGATALILILFSPALAGCLAALQEEPYGVTTACPGTGSSPPQALEVTHSYEKVRRAGEGRVPPQTETILLALMLPPGNTTDVERGVDLALDELASVGAEVTLVKTRVEALDGVTVRAAFNDTLTGERPGVVISGLPNDATDALVWLARDREMPLFATVADGHRIRAMQDTGGYFFRLPWSDATEGRAAAELIWASGCRSANVIAATDAKSTDVANAFRSAFQAKGGEVARVVSLQADGGNAAAAVDAVKFLRRGDEDTAPRPDAVYVIAPSLEAARVLRAAYNAKVSAESALFFAESAKGDAFVTAAGEDPNGHLLTVGLRGTSAMQAQTRATQAFERAFVSTTGLAPTNASARGYDAAYIAVLAAACGRDDHPETLRTRMPQVNDRNPGDTEVSGADPLFAVTTATARCAVNYVGASGDYDWRGDGEPYTGRYYFWAVSGDGAIKVTHSRVEPPAAS